MRSKAKITDAIRRATLREAEVWHDFHQNIYFDRFASETLKTLEALRAEECARAAKGGE